MFLDEGPPINMSVNIDIDLYKATNDRDLTTIQPLANV